VSVVHLKLGIFNITIAVEIHVTHDFLCVLLTPEYLHQILLGNLPTAAQIKVGEAVVEWCKRDRGGAQPGSSSGQMEISAARALLTLS
jgi:hypothetical protein